MTAYLMFLREEPIADPDAMAAYQGHNRAHPAPIAAKPLVVYGAIEALEGTAPDGMVVLEFPDAATARAWYDSAEYQAGIPLRQKAANYRAMLVEGWSMPTG
jgi:uncharacterized protein (DUF1330 family)